MKRILAAAALAAMTVSAASTAHAETLKYNDLELSTKAGQKELDRRIARAARSYCQAQLKPTGTRIQSRGTVECVRGVKQELSEKVAAAVGETRMGG